MNDIQMNGVGRYVSEIMFKLACMQFYEQYLAPIIVSTYIQ